MHKAVLSSASKLFQNLLQPNSDQTAHVIVSGVENRYLEMVIKFIYLGWCDVGQEDISEFLAAGKSLGVSDLNIEHNDELTIKDEVVLCGKLYPEDTKYVKEDVSTMTDEEKTLVNPLDNAHSGKSPKKEESDEKNIRVVCDKKIFGKFLCKVCGSAYLQSGGLNQHIMSKPEGKTYDCDQCDYKGTLSSSLIEHKQVKHSQTKHKCPQCDFQSTWATGVRRHKLSVHDKLRYGCDQCDHSNTKLDRLKNHKRTNHSGMVYTCNQCHYTTLKPDMLKDHKKLVHQVVPLKCDQCDIPGNYLQ